ncbi:MAG: bifunctional folylpolyglutamate synthase/dihydrofolate synthase [Candidatus Nanoarchaeia archaeon]
MANLQEIYSLSRFEINPGLESTETLLAALGNPHSKFKSVHIAGTNGKGSTAACIESVLRLSKKTGLYTSPHLHKFNERVRVNGVPVSDEVMEGLIDEIMAVAKSNDIKPTFFEFTTALAFLHFARSGVDIAIVETGMGGRLDSTNVITPLVSVITNIGLDHTTWLGSSKSKVAREKAGIIKEGVPVVSGSRTKEVLDIIEKVAKEKNAPIHYTRTLQVMPISESLEKQIFRIEGVEYTLPLLGRHQIDNARCAILTCRILGINEEEIKEGLDKVEWEGRMQIIKEDPLIIVDGAHNKEGMDALLEFIRPYKKDVLVVALKDKKKPLELLEDIAPLFKNIIITMGEYKPKDPHDIVGALGSGLVVKDVPEAIRKAKMLQEDGLLLVAGSIYMIGAAMRTLN